MTGLWIPQIDSFAISPSRKVQYQRALGRRCHAKSETSVPIENRCSSPRGNHNGLEAHAVRVLALAFPLMRSRKPGKHRAAVRQERAALKPGQHLAQERGDYTRPRNLQGGLKNSQTAICSLSDRLPRPPAPGHLTKAAVRGIW